MEVGSVLHRVPGDGPLPREIFIRVRPEPRRPKQSYRLRIRGPADVAVARKRGLPLYFLTSDVPTAHHYPMRFPPVLVLADPLAPLVETKFRTMPFRDLVELAHPSFEGLVTMMLGVDEIAAREMLVRNPHDYDPNRLAVLVTSEGRAAAATAMRLQEFAPIPVVGKPLPKTAVHAQDRKNLG